MSLQVVVPTALVIKGIHDLFKEVHPGLNTVYDQSLTFEETVRGLRAVRSAKQPDFLSTDTPEQTAAKQQERKTPTFPLLGHNRTILQTSSVLGARGRHQAIMRQQDDSWKQFSMVAGQFDFLFKFFDKDILALEAFELLYAAKQGVRKHHQVVLNIPTLGEWPFDLDWQELEDLQTQRSPTFYGAISGSVKVSGNFVLGSPPPVVIEWIQASLNNEVDWITLPPTE